MDTVNKIYSVLTGKEKRKAKTVFLWLRLGGHPRHAKTCARDGGEVANPVA